MATQSTGIIENTAVSGVRPSTDFVLRIANNDLVETTVQIDGFFVVGAAKTQYVLELFVLGAGFVATRSYFAEFDGFEFQVTTSSDNVDLSGWGKDADGNLVAAHRLVPGEFSTILIV